MAPKGYKAVPVPMDDFGMTPEALEQVPALPLGLWHARDDCSWS